MIRPARSALLAAFLLLGLSFEPPAHAADWPQWLGPQRTGASPEKGLPTTWPADGPAERWRVPLGKGFSALSIADGRVFTLYAEAEDEYVVCLSADDGTEIWRQRTGPYYSESQGGDGPRSTPAVDGGRVFVLGATGTLLALEADDGTEVWRRDLAAEFGGQVPKWGFSTSPLVAGGTVFVEVGGADGNFLVDMVVDRETEANAVALDKETGRTLWTALDDKMSYSSPVAFDIGGVPQVAFLNAYALVGLSPDDGRVHWRIPFKTRWDVSAATPLFLPPDRLFISAGNNGGVVRLKAADDSVAAEEVWRNESMRNHFGTSVHHDGHLYGFDKSILKCIDAATGAERWKARGFGKGTLLLADGHLIILGEKGNLGLVRATPNGFEKLADVPVMGGRCWTSPSLANGRLYLRDESEAVCLDLHGTAE